MFWSYSLSSLDQYDETDDSAMEQVRRTPVKFKVILCGIIIIQNNLLPLVEALETATNAFELQQGGDRLVRRLKEMQEEKSRNIQSKIDMLKQESLEALGKVSYV